MTRSEAEEHARRLQAEHPDHATHRFVPRRSPDGDWEVARVQVPERLRRGPLTPTVDASPRPSPADDPRTGNERRLPGLPGGLVELLPKPRPERATDTGGSEGQFQGRPLKRPYSPHGGVSPNVGPCIGLAMGAGSTPMRLTISAAAPRTTSSSPRSPRPCDRGALARRHEPTLTAGHKARGSAR
jgi:hypothetical protein